MLSSTPSPTYNRFQDQSVAPTATKEPSTSSSAMLDYLSPNSGSSLQHKKSYDDGMRPLDVLFGNKSKSKAEGTSSPLNNSANDSSQPRSEERQSVQSDAISPFCPYAKPFIQSQSLSPHGRPDSPQSASPIRTSFPTKTASPTSLSPQVNTLRHSASTDFLSATSSQFPPDSDMHEEYVDRSTLRPRPGSSSIYLSEDQQSEDSGPSLGPSVTLDQVPSITESPSVRDQLRLSADVGPGRSSPTYEAWDGYSIGSQKSSDDGAGLREHRLSSNSNSAGSRPASGSRSRPTSDSRRADVPHSIESGTDTEGEREESERQSDESFDAISPPPKESEEGNTQSEELNLGGDNEGDVNFAPSTSKNIQAESADDLEESEEPVESTSIATFIAPALPPIRFSLTSADFSDMLKNVGGMPSLKALDQLAKLAEEGTSTQPPTAAVPLTPSSGATVTNDAVPPPVPRNKTLRKLPPVGRPEKRPGIDEQIRAPPTAFGQSSSQSRWYDNERSKSQSSNPAHHDWPSTSSATHTTTSDSSGTRHSTPDSSDLVIRRLQEAYTDATERGAQQLKLDKGFVEAILMAFEQRQRTFEQLKVKYDGAKRTSQQYVDGLTVASTEYDQELRARRDAEAEVTRLRVLLSGQAVRLTTISGEVKKQELRQQMTQELSDNLDELEGNLSKLKVERDMALAEVEELSASKNSPVHANGEVPAAKLGRSLTMRLDNIKNQYQHELVPLTRQRDALNREILDLKATRDMFLEETTVLNARNEELAQLSAQYARRMDSSNIPDAPPTYRHEAHPPPHERRSNSFDRHRPQQSGSAPGVQPSFSTSTTTSSTTLSDESTGLGRSHKNPPEMGSPISRPGKFKWKPSKSRDPASATSTDHVASGRREHTFQQLSVLRLTRCDHCGDKMWGSQLRCTSTSGISPRGKK